jgi:ureidoglycolate dehydrogenase (NAD+)
VNQSHGFIVINPGVFMPLEAFKARVDELVIQIRNAPRAKGAERIYLPGEMEWEHREKSLKEGMCLPDHVLASLKGLAEDYRLDIEELFGDA